MLSCENKCSHSHAHYMYTSTLEWFHIKYLLSILTADCLHHPIQMAGTETTLELHALTVINSWLYYRIAGNFHKMAKNRFSRRKLSQIARLYRAKDATPPNFAEKTFANSHKTRNLRKFSPLNFPQYGV